jgi:signal peptidase I
MESELAVPGIEAAVPPPRASRGMAVTAALVTFFVSAAIGCVAVRRWRRALFWLLSDWAWVALYVAAVVTGHPRLFWVGLAGYLGWRIPAAVDSYRVVKRARALDEVRWPTLIRAWVVLTIGSIVMAAGIIRPFFAEAFQMPSGSMHPTLIIGDHIMVDKLHKTPVRGDVIVFKYPLDQTVDYLKRVIGLPGDVVDITSDGSISVNGAPLPRDRVADGCPEGADGLPDVHEGIPCTIWTETVDGRTYQVGLDRGRGPRDGHYVVPPENVFVLGDNRDNSSDSRVWGPVNLRLVKGIVRFIWWSAKSEAQGAKDVRWERVGMLVR